MSINLKYDKELKILTVKLKGFVTLTDMQQAMQQTLTSDQIPSDTNAIWDVSEMEFNNIDFEFQKNLVELRKQFNDNRGKAKIAILSDYALAEPLVKMYTILSRELNQVTKVFTLEEEARRWLNEEP